VSRAEAGSILDVIAARLALADRAAPAVGGGRSAVTWGELDRWALAAAGRLVAGGARPGRFVPVLAARGGAMVAGWLGVLRTGAACAPLSLDSPPDRLRHVLVELGAGTALADCEGAEVFRDLGVAIDVVRLEELRRAAVAPAAAAVRPAGGDPAVVIYTSGTTGRPKGVLLPHRGIVNTALWWAGDVGLGPADRLLCTWSTSFDMASFDVYRSLVAGSRLVFADDVERRDPRRLLRFVRGPGGATVTSMTPSLLRGMLEADEGGPTTLRTVTTAGEVLTKQLAIDCVRRWGVTIRNGYGPAEVSGLSTAALVDVHDERPPAIGLPLPNTRAYVLGRHGEELPEGVPGELYLAGAGVGLGYLGQPERTAAAFLPDPFDSDPSARMYRTGDRVVVRDDGQLEFLGRYDDQVKILGNRIEPNEVRGLLEEQPMVRAAAVHAGGQPPRLVAYVVLDAEADGLPTREEILRPLLRWLPPAVLPADMYVVDALPMTANDKVDFGALAGMRHQRLSGAADGPVELTPEQRQAAELFVAALAELEQGTAPPRVEELRPSTSFFTVGGHSLLAVTMLTTAERRGHAPVALRDFLADPTVAGLGRLLAGPREQPAPASAEPAGDRRFQATPAQQRFWFIDRVAALRPAYLLPAVVELAGPVDRRALRRAADLVLARHPALRSRFELDRRLRRVLYRTDGPPASATATDATGWPAEVLRDHVARLCWSPFDLATEPPARAEVVAAGERTLLVLVVHHAVADGWSRELLMAQLAEAYRADLERRPAELPEPTHPARLRTAAPGAGLDERTAALVAGLRGAPTDVRLHHDRPRRAVQGTAAATVAVALGAPLTGRLRAVTGALGCTPFMVAGALLAVALARRSDQRDFLFAYPWAGRDVDGGAEAVAMLVDTLVLRVDVREAPTWRALLGRVRDAATFSYRHADVPFEAVAAALHPDRDLSRPPVTPVYLSAQAGDPAPPRLGSGVTARYLPLEPLHLKYELELGLSERPAGWELAASYAIDLFDAGTATGLLAAVAAAAADLAGDPDGQPLGGDRCGR
jgi:amino acid adenylation domain-containing protein